MTSASGLFDGDTTLTEAVDILGGVLQASTEYSLVAIDLQGVIRLWNEGARRLYGHASAEIVGQPWTVLHVEEDVRAGLPRTIAETAARDGRWEGTVVCMRQDGRRFTARVVVTPRHAADGTPVGFLLISSDVSAQERLSAEVQRAWASARSMLEAAPDAMLVVNEAGEIQLVNAQTVRLFGYDRDELVGHMIQILIPERYHERHRKHLAAYFDAPRGRRAEHCQVPPTRLPVPTRELWGRRKDGVEVPVEISLSTLDTADGLLATAAIRDVTERRQAEKRLRDANVELETANRVKHRFLASMGHELRTPLNAILGFTGTLLMGLPGPLNDAQVKQLRTVQASGRHLLALINELLDLSRIESGKIELHIEPLDCTELLEDVVAGLVAIAQEKRIGLEVEPSTQQVTVHSDRRALKQILTNLTSNAIKFTDEGGIRLRLRPCDGAGVRFDVIDSGRGINVEDQARILAALEHIGSSTAFPLEGAGLGLYVCQTLSSLIGGEITFTSEFGRGTTFTLSLPG